MGKTMDLGQRIELVSMDPHCFDITISLYEQANGSGSHYLVHSYSGLPAAPGRLAAVEHAMQVLGGLSRQNGILEFPCGSKHQLAVRRTFLEACKLASDNPAEVRPLTVEDKKTGGTISVRSLGGGVYEVSASGGSSRVDIVVNGYRKLAQVEVVQDQPNQFRFACGQSHDALVGLLLPRALNVRAVLREQEMAAGRGTLVAPSAQK